MKNPMFAFLSKPKIAVPLIGAIIIIAGFFAYRSIGNAPATASIPTVSTSAASATIPAQQTEKSTIDLSFSKGGRIEAVLVKEGDAVHSGQVLARLSAPDAQGAISQTKGALDLAQAQYASLNSQYQTTKKQQDQIVSNAYRTLLSSGLAAVPNKDDPNAPTVSGTYTCDKEGSYIMKIYATGSESGYTIEYSGLESGNTAVKHDAPVLLGACGIQLQFPMNAYYRNDTLWTISIPNTKSSVYLANKNAYDLAVANREKVLSDLATTIGRNPEGSADSVSTGNSIAKAQVEAAQGAYEAALGAYQNNIITAPVNGIVTFIDKDLKVGQAATPNKAALSITVK